MRLAWLLLCTLPLAAAAGGFSLNPAGPLARPPRHGGQGEEVDAIGLAIAVYVAAGGGAGGIELEARGATGGFAGRQRAGAAYRGGAEAGRITHRAGARRAAAGSLGGLLGSESDEQPRGHGNSDLGADTGLPLSDVRGSVHHHGRTRFGVTECVRFQRRAALPGVEGGGERGPERCQWERGAGGGTSSARLSGGGTGGRG